MAMPSSSFVFFFAALILTHHPQTSPILVAGIWVPAATTQFKTEVSCHEKAALGCYSGCHYFKLSDKPGCAEICECFVPQQVDEILELASEILKKISACCSNKQQRYCYNACRLQGSQNTCASLCNCKLVEHKTPDGV